MFTSSIDVPHTEWRKPARRARAAAPATEKPRWSARRTLAFVVGTNVVAWGLIIAGIRAI